MTDHKNEAALDVEKLKRMADGGIEVDIPRPGFPLPEGYNNPQAGSVAHLCLDSKGIYQPSWSSLKIHKGDGMPTRQPFNCAGRRYRVLIGQWVDVPPEIIEVLSMAVVQSVRYGYDISDALGQVEGIEIVDETPRFAYSVIPSA